MLQRWPVTSAPPRVLVVENPAVLVVAAIERFDSPVVCSAGVPTVAVVTLVEQLIAAGSRVDVHADLDSAGLGIVRFLTADSGAVPFRMSAADYRDVVGRAGGLRDERPVPPTPWDPELGREFDATRLIVFEEQIIDQILV